MRGNCKNKAVVTTANSDHSLREGLLPLWHYVCRASGLDPDEPEGISHLSHIQSILSAWVAAAPTRARERTMLTEDWYVPPGATPPAGHVLAPEPEIPMRPHNSFTVEQAKALRSYLGDMAVGMCDHGGGSMFVMCPHHVDMMIPRTFDFADTDKYVPTALTKADVLQLYHTRLQDVSHYARCQGTGWQGRARASIPSTGIATGRHRSATPRTGSSNRQPIPDPRPTEPLTEAMTT